MTKIERIRTNLCGKQPNQKTRMADTAPAPAPATKYIRTADGQFQCPHCDKKCEKQNTMYYHITKNHLQNFKFICEFCPSESPMKFVQKSAYQQHLATKHSEKIAETTTESADKNPHVGVCRKCPGCDYSTRTKGNLFVHYAREHAKEWIPKYTKDTPCIGCNKQYPSSSAYLYHAIACIKPVPENHANMLSLIK